MCVSVYAIKTICIRIHEEVLDAENGGENFVHLGHPASRQRLRPGDQRPRHALPHGLSPGLCRGRRHQKSLSV